MTDTLIVLDNPTPNDDAVPVTWPRPAWAATTEARDGYIFYYGEWVVANPGRCEADTVFVRVSGTDEFVLLPDGTVVAQGEPTTVEVRIGQERRNEGIALDAKDAAGLAAAIQSMTKVAQRPARKAA